MPTYGYVGLVGGFIALGLLIWTMWNQEEPHQNKPNDSRFNPGPGYDMPRSWNETRSSRKRPKSKNDNQCVICYEELSVRDEIRRLRCNHKFHSQCISKWFLVQKTCPTCREEYN